MLQQMIIRLVPRSRMRPLVSTVTAKSRTFRYWDPRLISLSRALQREEISLRDQLLAQLQAFKKIQAIHCHILLYIWKNTTNKLLTPWFFQTQPSLIWALKTVYPKHPPPLNQTTKSYPCWLQPRNLKALSRRQKCFPNYVDSVSYKKVPFWFPI